jgi:protein-disulfide isomerase
MAQSMNLKPFYAVLGVVAVVGAAAIWMARTEGSAVDVGLIPVSATSFPGHLLGSDSAAVEIVEYADFECGACAHFAILTLPDIKQRLVATGRVRLRFRDFPLPGHSKSPAAHMAAACAGEQGRFWEMKDQLFFGQQTWVRDRRPARRFEQYAETIGLDRKQYEDCVDDDRYAAQIAAGREEGMTVGVNSTPSFLIGGLLVVGSIPYDSVVALVRRAEGAGTR